LTRGPIPAGMKVCHHCDNPPCVRPDHLFLGTTKDNAEDMVRKGRNAAAILAMSIRRRGEGSTSAKLTTGQVIEMRRLYDQGGISCAELGRRYGIHAVSASLIVRRKRWRHIP
jgi:hypothetical protein